MSDERDGWEIAHLPGMGPYALDSYRIFYRDRLREINTGEPEWKRVVPLDKDLKPYLKWRWAQDGWDWNELSGKRRRLAPEEASAVAQDLVVEQEDTAKSDGDYNGIKNGESDT
jgi:hypothetical protein